MTTQYDSANFIHDLSTDKKETNKAKTTQIRKEAINQISFHNALDQIHQLEQQLASSHKEESTLAYKVTKLEIELQQVGVLLIEAETDRDWQKGIISNEVERTIESDLEIEALKEHLLNLSKVCARTYSELESRNKEIDSLERQMEVSNKIKGAK